MEEHPPHQGIFLARPERVPGEPHLAVKDLLDTAGLVTTYGSILFAGHRPERSAVAVTRAERAGYTVVGKANLHEFAYGVTSENPHFGAVPNPLAPGRIAGGSSGGSAAALAAGLAEAALGTDTAGSIRIPAACCGVVGLKPSFDLVPVQGCFPLAPSLDHVGPMATTVADCADLLRALVPDVGWSELESLEEVEVGVAWLDAADPLVRTRVEEAAALFPSRRPLDLPHERDFELSAIFNHEVSDVHRELFAEHADSYGEDVRAKLQRALETSDAEYAAAQKERERFRQAFDAASAGVDLVLTPTLTCVAPRSGTVRESGVLTKLTSPFNVLGRPAVALPCGSAEDGLPASVQLVGRPGEDALVLAAAELLEQALSLDRGTPERG